VAPFPAKGGRMSIFEVVMLVCFGVAWPFSIHKSLRTVSTEGKSLVFLIIVVIGYASGILHKMFYNYDRVIYLYALNALMVCIDIGLFVRNSRAAKNS
jgi:uncharacterized membrane protein YbjE (DUF340 family)